MEVKMRPHSDCYSQPMRFYMKASFVRYCYIKVFLCFQENGTME